MNIQLLYPALLVALAGLLVPLLIHLWNRRRGRVVLFGSTQFLEATQRKKVSRISFTQPLLFLLRALMVGACVLLLVEPVRVSIMQILPNERRVLARDFFLLDENNDNTNIGKNTPDNTWSLFADASTHAQAPDSIAVYFTPELNDFQGLPPSLPTHITWHEIPPKNDTYHILRAWHESGSKLALIIGKSDEEYTTFKRYVFRKKDVIHVIQSDELPDIIFDKNEELIYFKNKKNTIVSVEKKPKLNAIIFYDNSFRKDRNYLVAALKSVSEYTDIQIDIKKERIENGGLDFNLNEEPDAVFWLSEKTLNDSIILSSKFQLFTYKKNEIYREDVVDLSSFGGDGKSKKIYVLTRRLTDAETTTKLPQKLLEILLTSNDFDQQIARFDQRKIAPSQYNVTRSPNPQKEEILPEEKKKIIGFHNMLWWLLLGLFFVERMFVMMNYE